jgi:hypothetical protein
MHWGGGAVVQFVGPHDGCAFAAFSSNRVCYVYCMCLLFPAACVRVPAPLWAAHQLPPCWRTMHVGPGPLVRAGIWHLTTAVVAWADSM